ncbi:MAG: diacylglycerol kinase family lipid kinase [Woeseiaceae bacterium]|nr:diacylglycerol kinase family lipid kinase [Woeseiaceae bacterium]
MTISAPIPLFINPAAGRGRAKRRIAAISRLLASSGVPNECITTTARGDIERLIAEAADAGHRRIIVAGGDGTVHEAVNGIMQSDVPIDFGLVPTGTGNDFAGASSIPSHWEHAVALLADRLVSGAPAVPVDIGRCNDRYFANGAGIGFDATVSAIAARIRWPIGDLVYVVALLRALRGRIETPRLRLSFDDREIVGPATLAAFSNGPRVGGMFLIAPEAQNNDGMLDLIYAAPVSRLRVLALVPKLIRGRHMDAPEVEHHSLKSCTVVAHAPLVAHLDGEIQPPQSRFDIELLPGAVGLL